VAYLAEHSTVQRGLLMTASEIIVVAVVALFFVRQNLLKSFAAGAIVGWWVENNLKGGDRTRYTDKFKKWLSSQWFFSLTPKL